MNSYRFGDGGFSFIERVLDNIKFAWKPYLIITIFTSGIPAIITAIGAGLVAVTAISGSGIMALLSGLIALVGGIFCALIALVGVAAIMKCINDTNMNMGYIPTASECLRFGFSKLGKMIVFSLLIIACNIVLWIPISIILTLLMVVTLGIGVIVIVPAIIFTIAYLYMILTIATINIVIHDMPIIESITNAWKKSMDGFKENILFALKLFLINIIAGIAIAIISIVPILGWIAAMIFGSLLSIAVTVATRYRFFEDSINEFEIY